MQPKEDIIVEPEIQAEEEGEQLELPEDAEIIIAEAEASGILDIEASRVQEVADRLEGEIEQNPHAQKILDSMRNARPAVFAVLASSSSLLSLA